MIAVPYLHIIFDLVVGYNAASLVNFESMLQTTVKAQSTGPLLHWEKGIRPGELKGMVNRGKIYVNLQ